MASENCPPTYLPHWAERSGNLAGLLAFPLFANLIRLDTLQAEDIVLGV